MNLTNGILAQISIDLKQAFAPWANLSQATRELFLVLGVIVALALGILIWAAFIRKPGKRRHHKRHHHHHHSHEPAPVPGETQTEADPGSRKRKWRRRRRRDHRPRNPTLAETGGLPPVRDEKSVDSNL